MSSPESLHGFYIADIVIGLPALAASFPPLIFQSTAEHINPLRTLDLPGLPNFFDHSGNCVNGSLAAMAIVYVGTLVEDYIPLEKQRRVIVGTSVVAAAGSIGINVAYEAGVAIPPYPKKPAESAFDAPDALYGGVTGALYSLIFCLISLRQMRKNTRYTTDTTNEKHYYEQQ